MSATEGVPDPQRSGPATSHRGRLRKAALVGAAVLVALVALYAAAGFWWLPRLVEKDLPPWVERHYGLHLTLGPFHFNPFRFDMEADDVALHAPDGQLLLQAGRLGVDFDPTGLLHRTWRFDRVTLADLQLNLVLAKDGTLNLVDLLHRLVPPSTAPAAPPPRVVVGRLEAIRASVQLTDLRGAAPAKATIAPIGFALTGLSTLAGAKASQTLDAALADGTTLHAQGDLVLEPAFSTHGQLAVHGLQAATWLPFLRGDLRIGRLQGSADASTGWAYTAAAGLRLDDLGVQVAGLRLAAPGAETPLIAMQKIDLTGGSVDVSAHTLMLERLGLAHGTASLNIDAAGRTGWSELVPPGPAGAPGPAWHLSMATVQLDQVGLDYADRQRQPPLVLEVGNLAATLQLAITTGPHTDVAATGVAFQAQALALPAARPGGAALTLDSAAVEGGSLQLAARTVAARKVTIQGGNASIARDADGSIDWLRRFAPAPGAPAASTAAAAAGAWHYDIAQLDVGSIDLALADRSAHPPFKYDVQLASVTAQHLASDAKVPVSFDARLVAKPGGTLHTHGSVSTSGANLQASVQLDQLALAPFEPLVRRYTGFDATAGPLSLSADLHDVKALSVAHLSVDLPTLVLRRGAGGEPLLSASRVQVRQGQATLAARQVVIGQLMIAQGAVRARVRPDGRLDWLADTPPLPASTPAASNASWNVRIDALKLEQMAAHYADLSGRTPLGLDVARIDLGTALTLTAGGARPQVEAQGLQAQLHGVSLALDRGRPAVTLATASVLDGQFDLDRKRVGATSVVLSGGSARIVRDAHGNIDLLRAFAAPASAAATGATTGTPWQYAVDKLEIDGFALQAQDLSFGPSLALGGQIDATVQHLSNHGQATFDAKLALADQRGTLDATGTATLSTGQAHAHLVARSLALQPLQALVSHYTTLALQSGRLDTDLQLTYAAGDFKADGGFDVKDLALRQAGSNAHVLSFDSLAARDVALSSSAHRLTIGEADLARPDTRIAIAKDHSVNLSGLTRDQGSAAARPADVAASAPAFELDVRRLRVHDGSVDFSDQSLVLPFATKVTAIDATIVGASNRDDRHADVKASGSIQAYGSASVNGSVVLFDPRRFTDLRVKFNNVRVAPLSPYTATFAGRKVESGKLWLDLDYKIDRGELQGKNDIRLSDFSLGERVESPTAIDVPLNLAVSLLTDSKGEIHLSVPVRGDLDDPQFKIGGAITHAVGSMLGRIVSAPFRLIGRLFGGSHESLASIDFASGSAELEPEQREKLDALTHAMQERPKLRLVVGAPYDERSDTQALKAGQTRRMLAARLSDDGPADRGGSALVAFDDPATRRALRTMGSAEKVETTAGSSAPPPDDRAAYEALFQRLVDRQTLTAGALQILATQRADRIAQYLTKAGVERGRLDTGQVQAMPSRDDGTVDAQLMASGAASAP